MSVLPTHLSYDAPWPVRKIPLRCTPHFIAYNRESKVRCKEVRIVTIVALLKPVTDEQVLYDKFSYDKFYLPSARVYMQHILYDQFSCNKFYFTGVNVSTSLL